MVGRCFHIVQMVTAPSVLQIVDFILGGTANGAPGCQLSVVWVGGIGASALFVPNLKRANVN